MASIQRELAVIDRVRRSDHNLQHLRLDLGIEYHVRRSWTEIRDAVQDNDVITSVYLGPYFYSSVTEEQRCSILEAIGAGLSNLQVLTIGTLDRTKAYISAASLGRAVKSATNLQTLRVERSLRLESQQDVEILAAGVENHPSLERVSLFNLHPAHENCSLDPILYSIGTIPHLGWARIGLSEQSSGTAGHEIVTPSAVACIATNMTLSWLELQRFPLQDAHVQALAAQMARGPSYIKVLDLPFSKQLGEDAWQALLDMLYENCHLEAINMYCSCPEARALKEAVRFYLRLNVNGRQRLRDASGSREEWLNLASAFTSDQSASMVLLRESPWVCERRLYR